MTDREPQFAEHRPGGYERPSSGTPSAQEQGNAGPAKWAWLWSGASDPPTIWLRRLNRFLTPALGAAALWDFTHGRYWAGGFCVLICVARCWDD